MPLAREGVSRQDLEELRADLQQEMRAGFDSATKRISNLEITVNKRMDDLEASFNRNAADVEQALNLILTKLGG